MTRIFLLLVLVAVIARVFWRFVDAVVRGASGSAAPGGRAPASVKMLPCPVCGTFVVPGKAISLIANGAPVYFCSETCRTQFDAR